MFFCFVLYPDGLCMAIILLKLIYEFSWCLCWARLCCLHRNKPKFLFIIYSFRFSLHIWRIINSENPVDFGECNICSGQWSDIYIYIYMKSLWFHSVFRIKNLKQRKKKSFRIFSIEIVNKHSGGTIKLGAKSRAIIWCFVGSTIGWIQK